jgi:hypothetical protein
MLSCSTPTQDVGVLKQGSIPVFHYIIENTGDVGYVIRGWANCGCSTPMLPKNTIEPGEKLCMRLQFDTMGKVGKNEKKFGLFYGDKDKLTLSFTAQVVE